MSRAFVKEPDGEPAGDEGPPPAESPHPNYVTPRGLAALRERLAHCNAQGGGLDPADPASRQRLAAVRREARRIERQIERAILVRPSEQPRDEVRFGAIVTVRDEDGQPRDVAIVGEDEADARGGRVSWVSPLARALLGGRVGDVRTWQRPSGEVDLAITAIRYPDE